MKLKNPLIAVLLLFSLSGFAQTEFKYPSPGFDIASESTPHGKIGEH